MTTTTPPERGADSLPPETAGGAQPHPRRWAILAVVATAQFMVLLDSTIVNVALPSIAVDLNASMSDQQWILDSYVLLFAGLLLLGGRCADLLGRRRMFLVGLGVFTLASLACGMATGPTTLIIARAVQGAGAALLSPAALSIVVTVFADPRERRTALTVWGGLAVLGGTFGVVFGGLIVKLWSWSWAFFINLPIALVGLVAALAVVPAAVGASAGARRPFDLVGAVTATGALLLLVYGLIGASEHGWDAAATIASLVAALALFVVLGIVETRARDPLMPPRLLRTGLITVSGVGLLFTWAGQIAVFFMISVYQQRVLEFSPFQAGLGMLAMGLPALAVVAVLPKLIQRLGLRTVYLLGAVLVLLGTAYLLRLPVEGQYVPDLLPGLAVMGFGLPCCFVSLTTMGVSSARPEDSGVASGLLNTFSQTGAALGMATLISLAAARSDDLTQSGRTVAESLTGGFRWGLVATTAVAGANVLLAIAVIASWRRGARKAGVAA